MGKTIHFFRFIFVGVEAGFVGGSMAVLLSEIWFYELHYSTWLIVLFFRGLVVDRGTP
jgi:hypothetical protein